MEGGSKSVRRRSVSKSVRLLDTPDYIPTLNSSTVMDVTRTSTDSEKPKKKWGKIKNVDQIRTENASKDVDSSGKENKSPRSTQQFENSVQLLIQSKKAIRKVRSKYSAEVLKPFTKRNSLNVFDFDLTVMHNQRRRQRHVKIAALQKMFLDELPVLAERTVQSNLEQKLAILRKIQSVNSYDKVFLDSLESSVRPPSDQPTRRQSMLRKSIDLTESLSSSIRMSLEHDEIKEKSDQLGLSLSEVKQEYAIAKSREKIEAALNLPKDRLARFTTLKANVNKINTKFHDFVSGKKRSAKGKDLEKLNEEKPFYAPSRFVEQGMAKDFFKRYARIVVIVLQWINMIMNKKYDFEKELKSFVDIANDIEDQAVSSTMQEHGLTFDKKFFKANKDISLSAEVRKTLTTSWQSRTPEMIKQVINGLQSLRSLSEYPLQTQEKLCKVAWYQMIGPKKAIIRQGHYAESFYFILSGTAFVKKMVQDPVTKETKGSVAARLTRGHSFGEIGLLFDTLRTATVESATPMELLVIGKEDFVRIFMKAENPDEEADHIKFMRKIPFMPEWPVDCLKEEPGACLTHYFKRGSLITDNDRHSEWIYFIMSGTCEVLKKLKAVKPRDIREIRPKSNPISDIILPELGMPHNNPKIDTGKSKSKRTTIHPEVYEDMTKFYESIRRKHEEEIRAKTPAIKREDSESHEESERSDTQLPRICVRAASAPRKSMQETNPSVQFTEKRENTDGGIYKTEIKLVPIEPDGKRRPVSRAKFQEASPLVHSENFLVPTQEKLNATYRPVTRDSSNTSSSTPEEDVFVIVELLHQRDSFGLNTLKYCLDESDDVFDVEGHDDTPILSLVSRGAEVIMLSKKVFLKYADQRCKMKVRDHIKVYPPETVLQDNMQVEADWNLYKENILVDYLEKRKLRQTPIRCKSTPY